jgi:AcrR family transcriptional regulator
LSKTPAELLQTFRRDQIVAAARDVIGENGYEQSSVDQIAKRAGLSRSTVYEYFSSKEEILKGSFAAHREELAETLDRSIQRARGIEAQLAAFFEICLSRVDQNREFFLAISFPLPLDEASAAEGPGGTEFALVIKHFNDAVDRILEDGFVRGELLHPVSPADRTCLGTLVVGAMGARCRLDAPPPLEESAAQLASFALHGLAPASGRDPQGEG